MGTLARPVFAFATKPDGQECPSYEPESFLAADGLTILSPR